MGVNYLVLHARLFYLRRDLARRRIDDLVSRSGLGDYLDQRAGELPLRLHRGSLWRRGDPFARDTDLQ